MQSISRNAFTLVELLVVLAIVSVLAAMLLPSVERALSQAQIAACANNQRQIHYAITAYGQDGNMTLSPPFWGQNDGWFALAMLTDYTTATVDAAPMRHVYRGLGRLWVDGYLPDLTAAVCAGYENGIDPQGLVYQGASRINVVTPASNAALYSIPTDTAARYCVGTYSVYSWGSGYKTPRKLKVPHPQGYGLVQCCFRTYPHSSTRPIEIGAHGMETMNSMYEDGHLRALSGAGEHARQIFAQHAGSNNYYYGGSNHSGFVWAENWWAWARDMDRR